MSEAAATTEAGTAARPKARRWRRGTAWVLIVVGSLLGLLSSSSLWIRNLLLNTDRYVATVEPLAEEKSVQGAVASFAVDAIFENVDVEEIARDALPERAAFLAAPLTNGIENFAEQAVQRILASEQFQELWSAANRRAHDRVVALLTDEPRSGGALQVENGVISISLDDLIDRAKQRLSDAGLTFVDNIDIPKSDTEFVMFKSKGLANVRGVVSLLDTLVWVLPVLMILAYAGSVLCLTDRRRGLIRIGISFSVTMALLAVFMALARNLYLDAIDSPNLTRAAASDIFDTVTRFFRYGIWTCVVLGLVIAGGAWLSGPSRPAVRARDAFKAGASGLGERVGEQDRQPGPISRFVTVHKRACQIGVFIFAFALLLAFDQPRIPALVFLVVLVVVLLGVIELLTRDSNPVPATASEAPTTSPAKTTKGSSPRK